MDKRCNNKAEEGPLGNIRENSEEGFRAAEGGQKPKYLVPEIRVALLEWFVDAWTTLMLRLFLGVCSLFRLKAQILDNELAKKNLDFHSNFLINAFPSPRQIT